MVLFHQGLPKKNSAWVWPSAGSAVMRIGAAAVAFLCQAWLARHYSGHAYGIYVFCWSILLLVDPLAERGLAHAALKFIPIYQEKKNIGDLAGFLRWTLKTVARTSVFLAILAISVLLICTWFFPDKPYILPLTVTFLALPLYALSAYYMNVATCFNATIPAFAIYQFGLPVLLILGSIGLAGVQLSGTALCGLLVTALAIICLAEWRFVGVRFIHPLQDTEHDVGADIRRKQIGEWRHVSAALLRNRIFEVVYYHAGPAVVGLLLAPDVVSCVFVAHRIAALLITVGFGISFVAGPNLVRQSVHDQRELRDEYRRVLLVLASLSFFCAGGLIVFRESVLGLFGLEYVTVSHLLIGFIPGTFVFVLAMPAQYLLAATGYHRELSFSTMVSGIVYVALLFVLVEAYGAMGSVAAFAVCAAARTVALMFLVERNFRFPGYMRL